MKKFPLTGEEIAVSAVKDFKAFFLGGRAPSIRVKAETAHIAAARRDNDGQYIALSPDMANDVIKDADRFHFHLLIIGHEIAHVVHRHLMARTRSPEEDRSLEFWADFYGAKVMMTLLIYGQRIRSLHNQLYDGERFHEGLESIGRAAGLLVTSVYNDHAKYPPKLMRVGLISNGISSVLEPHMLAHKVDPIWRFGVIKRVGSHEAVRELTLTSPESVVGGEDDIERAMDWHRRLQGKDRNLTSGINPKFEHFLGTNFNVPAEAIEELRKARLTQLQAEGYLLDEADGTV
ncbi:hypothetical protein [Sphingobium sp. LF-16]|uniref:hypothetical protein n=1 Tax=unclassified Sphingobium TaxID=2611147 RepID=UPI0013DE313C|nr:hypothetical protein [Sphingobium sp. LF-16]